MSNMGCKCCKVKTKQKPNKENVLPLLAGMHPNQKERGQGCDWVFILLGMPAPGAPNPYSADITFKDT